jgi:hypothetical protein
MELGHRPMLLHQRYVVLGKEVTMVGSLVITFCIALVATACWVRRTMRRRADAAPVITTWPEIELHEAYGGWNANAYDAGTGRDRRAPAPPTRPSGALLFTPPRRAR